MDETVTVRDVMAREFVGVSEGDAVSGVAELMEREGAGGAVVLRGREPIGTFDERDLLTLVAEGDDPEATEVGEAMSETAITVGTDDPVVEATEVLLDRDVRWAVVEDGDEVVGVLSERDLLVAHAMFPAEDDGAAGGVAATVQEGGFESDGFENQGVCEVCGAFASSLRPHNGQLVCADCLGP